MEYVDVIDHLLGLVGREVLVRVSDAEAHPGFVLLHGTLGQGERETFSEPGNTSSFFAVGDAGDGVYIYREAFTHGSYDAEAERLTLWLGPVAIAIEPRMPPYTAPI